MLVQCPECELQISDKAVICPHCGYPLKNDVKQKTYNRSNKRRRLPNGFGQISEIKGKYLRKPFRAMVTVGKTDTGKPISKLLKPEAYFESYNDAYAALLEYNKSPYDLESETTMFELYNLWSPEYFKEFDEDNRNIVTSTNSAWAYCSLIYNMRVADVRTRHIKGVLESPTRIINGKEREATPAVKSKMKTVLNKMLDYAMEYELADKNYARMFQLKTDEDDDDDEQAHIPYSIDELKLLWDNLYKIPFVDVLLMQCYSGWRPSEITYLRTKNIFLNEQYMMGGMKTPNGKNRVVPIHPAIFDIVKNLYDNAVEKKQEFLIMVSPEGTRSDTEMFTYYKYKYALEKIYETLRINSEHRPHDGRMTFTTLAKYYNLDEYAIKYIVGHSIRDITEKVYTKRDASWLKEEICKIKVEF